jgi:hypothetical protein
MVSSRVRATSTTASNQIYLNRNALAFLHLASIRRMLDCDPS